MPSKNFISSLESLLFISGEPVAFTRLAKILETDEEVIEQSLQTLAVKYTNDVSSGLMLVMKDKKAVIATKPENATLIEILTKGSMQENLSRVALEVLSIIAYRAPISRTEIETIRGVNCSFTLRNLLLRDLIERQTNPTDTREYVYSPTFRLLQLLGLQSVQNLPDYDTLSVDGRLTTIIDIPSKQQESEKESAPEPDEKNIQKESE